MRLASDGCSHPDVRTAVISALKPLPKPQQAPPAVVPERPTWTTWATSHADVTQEDTLALGEAVLEHGFRPGSLRLMTDGSHDTGICVR